MKEGGRCWVCCEALGEEERYHASCSKGLFGEEEPPELPYEWDELNALAENIVRSSITVPGVQPKLSLHLERKGKYSRQRLTLIGLEGGYILKPPVEAYPEMPELEHLTMRIARLFGIETVECGLIPLKSGERSYITRRIDRRGKNRLHMEDMCQLTDKLAAQKYRGSMEQVGKAVWKYSSNPGLDVLRFFEVALFSFLTGNADMHLKNYSLLYRKDGMVGLAPAYDLLATTLLLPEDQEETALALNGKKRQICRDDFICLARALKLADRQVENVFIRFERACNSAFNLIDHGFISAGLKDRYAKLVKERWERVEKPVP